MGDELRSMALPQLLSCLTSSAETTAGATHSSLRQLLETLDGHIGRASGPKPYSYPDLLALRQDVARGFIGSEKLLQTLSNLSLLLQDRLPIDLNEQVDRALQLTSPLFRQVHPIVDFGKSTSFAAYPNLFLLASYLLATHASCADKQATAPKIVIRHHNDKSAVEIDNVIIGDLLLPVEPNWLVNTDIEVVRQDAIANFKVEIHHD